MTDEPDTELGGSRDLDRAGTSDHLEAASTRSRSVRAYRWLLHNWITVALVLVGGFLVVGSLLNVGIPRWFRIIGVSAALSGVAIGRPVATKVKAMLWDPNWIYLVDLDARIRTGAVYRIPAQQFREWSVTDGQLDWLSPNLCVGRSVDLELREVTGTWRGTLTDRQLLRALSAVEECRDQLEDAARRGERIDMHAFTIVRKATLKATGRLVQLFEEGTLPDKGDGLTSEIDSVLEDAGLARDLGGDILEDDEIDLSELDLDLDAVTGGGAPRAKPAGNGTPEATDD